MTGRAARQGAPASMRPAGQGAVGEGVSPARAAWTLALPLRPLLALALALALALLAPACAEEDLRRIDETYELVGGQPQVDPSASTIDRRGDAKAGDFASSSPVQIDAFVQQQVAKVDILWVIDNSGSMSPKQEKVKQNFQAFIAKLVESNSQIDYHIGVITTDTYNPAESGKLQNKAALSKPWVGPDTCNPAAGCDPVAKFRLNADVGIVGSGDEKGLLAATMAVSAPLTSRENAGFLRPDAALFIILIGDEEDSSCTPTRADHAGGCSEPLTYGSTDYYARFFEGLKGYGRKDFVTLSAIVAVDQTPVSGTNPPIAGCRASPTEYAQYAPRFIEVARKTGGIVTSICDANYLPALQNLGFLATGAKSTFLLSRAPYPDQIKVYVTAPGGQRELKQRGRDWEYRPCTGPGNQSVFNAVEFLVQNNALPPASSTIEVEYPVNVRGVRCP